ncbi:hypothetical protein ABW20_dc0109354 [Dactylellina cionopaga]|nr:hypothetical protein ABW20_dc0109354 [Dactylellina cionopaga]
MGSLLISSASAVSISPKDISDRDQGLLSQQVSNDLSKLTMPEAMFAGAPFRIFKRQIDVELNPGSTVDTGGATDITTTDDIQLQSDAEQLSEDVQNGADSGQIVVDAQQVAIDAQQATTDTEQTNLDDSAQQQSGVFLDNIQVPEASGDNLLESTKSIVIAENEGVIKEEAIDQAELQSLAENVQAASELLVETPVAADVDYSQEIKESIDSLKDKSPEEVLSYTKDLLYRIKAKDVAIDSMVRNMVPVLANVVDGNITSSATAGLTPIDMAIVDPAAVARVKARLRKRGLQKRGWFDFSVGLEILGIKLSTSLRAGTGSAPDTSEPKVIVVQPSLPAAAAPPVTINVVTNQQQPKQQEQQQSTPIQYSSQEPAATVPGWGNTQSSNWWDRNTANKNTQMPNNNAFRSNGGSRNRGFSRRKF